MDIAHSRQEIFDRYIAGKNAAYTQPHRLKRKLAFQLLAHKTIWQRLSADRISRNSDSLTPTTGESAARPAGGLQAVERAGQTIPTCDQVKIRVGAEDCGQPFGDKR